MGDGLDMTGPVDHLVVEFAGTRVPGTCCNESSIWSPQGTVRILELAFIRKETDGSATGLEVTDYDGAGTATAVSNRVSRRPAGRWARQDQQQAYAQEPAEPEREPAEPRLGFQQQKSRILNV